MNYPLRSKPKKENRYKVFLILGFFILLSGVIYLLPNFSRKTLTTISEPVWFSKNATANVFGKAIDFVTFKSSLIAEKTRLEEEVASLRSKETDYQVLLKENEELKTLIGRNEVGSKVVGAILSKPPRSPYDTLVLDVGSNQGVVQGAKVYLSDGIIIGKIVEVGGRDSLVELFSSGNQKIESILSRTGATFTISGKGGANFELEVPKDTDIVWGDMFMYPGLSSALLGSVYYIDESSQSSFKTAYIRIPISIFSTKYVFVEK